MFYLLFHEGPDDELFYSCNVLFFIEEESSYRSFLQMIFLS